MMAQVDGPTYSGIDDLEKDLTCSICTDILYQPLTLLDCLHSFCGSCLKEWFSFQAASAARDRHRSTRPYTCPSCRDTVKKAKADWRVTSSLEGYLKAHPDRVKSLEEREELGTHYKPGDDVLPPVQRVVEEDDSEDERLLARVRDMSMADATAGGTRPGNRRGGDRVLDDGRRRHSRLTESRLREHDAGGPQIGHQPSLRSLLSVSDADLQEVQAEILQSIYSEGLLDGIDIDNLTAEQEEELTERIAEAYRRRQRHRDRSRDQSHRSRERRPAEPPPRSDLEVNTGHLETQGGPSPPSTQPVQARARPPIARPHLFEQTPAQSSLRVDARSSTAANGQRSRSAHHETATAQRPAARSATDLSQRPRSNGSEREGESRTAGNGRSFTDPNAHVALESRTSPRPRSSDRRNYDTSDRQQQSSGGIALQSNQQAARASNNDSPAPAGLAAPLPPHQSVRPAVSHSNFAPEPLSNAETALSIPSIKCHRCEQPSIQLELHYNCNICFNGSFNLCLRCYRAGRGCDHWFGFGYRAFERWNRSIPPRVSPATVERPHILTPRRYLHQTTSKPQQTHQITSKPSNLQEGAFCDRCLIFTNSSYWYCSICLDGAWGFCSSCIKTGHHCTHQLLGVAHISTQNQPYQTPGSMPVIPLPHLSSEQLGGEFVALPAPTFCDLCHRPIAPSQARLHCYGCSGGDYDVCEQCYAGLESQGKSRPGDGMGGWRRCLQGHRMAVVVYDATAEGGYLLTTVREPVGGSGPLKEETVASDLPSPPPSDAAGLGFRCLALYSYFPAEGVQDELAFPKNAEIREVSKVNEEWYFGSYAGANGLFPSNHVRMI